MGKLFVIVMKHFTSGAPALAGYLCPIFETVTPQSPTGIEFANWCWDHQWVFGVDLTCHLATRTKCGVRKHKRDYEKPMAISHWQKLHGLATVLSAQTEPCPIIRNADLIGDLVGLDSLDRDIFRLLSKAMAERPLLRLLEEIVGKRIYESHDIIALMIRAKSIDVQHRLSNGELVRLNFIDGAEQRPGEFELYIPYRTMDALRSRSNERHTMEESLLGKALMTRLHTDDFSHLCEERDFAVRLLRGAIRKRQTGVNILLYGPPGVGKSELAKVLAQEADCALFSIGESTEDHDEPDRDDRLSALYAADRLAHKRGSAILMFDEMEDLLSGGYTSHQNGRSIRRSGSKIILNRLLETNKTPIIWITNSIAEFDPAYLRRMIFSIEMKTPPMSVRAQQWKRLSRRSGVKVSGRRANELAASYAWPVSYARSALQAVAAADGDDQELNLALDGIARPIEGPRTKRYRKTVAKFDLSLLNPDCDLSSIDQKLRSQDCPRDVSFCFYGPPGTGKSALARHIATILHVEVLEKRSSDLLSPWVGETERNIAAAFEEAAQHDKLLLIDEAESLFWAREGATRSWEVSTVNEFLVNLEQAAIPVVCTTNHLSRMDSASLRRFTFKVKLDYLSREQVCAAYRSFFDEEYPGHPNRSLRLTPGDFAVVKKQLRFHQHGERCPAKIVELLEIESKIKQGNKASIGF